MANVYYYSNAIDDEIRREQLFSGDFIIYKNINAIKKLCDFANTLSEAAFHPHSPQYAHHFMEQSEYLKTVDVIQRKFTNHPQAKKLFYSALISLGVDASSTFCDWFPLRIQPGSTKLLNTNTTGLQAHRDSWYANIMCQTNWWLPIYPMKINQAVVFYPKYWAQPIKNSSKGWDLQTFRHKRAEVRKRSGSYQEVYDAYPHIYPKALLETSDEIRFILEPGDILCFSAAHLHASAKNNHETARFSSEIRSVNVNDFKNNRGPLNIDALSTGNSLVDFFQMNNDTPIVDYVK